MIALCAEQAGGQVLQAVNFNSPNQVVIAGHVEAIDRGIEAAKAAGAKRAVKLPVNVEARAYEGVEQIREALRRHVNSPVRWSESVLAMRDRGAASFVEFGPGKVLAGLCKRIDRDLSAHCVESPDSLDKVLAVIRGESS